MTDKFSDKAPHHGGFQQTSDKNYNNPPDFRIFKEPSSRNSCDQHSVRNIPSQNYGDVSSHLQLPPPPLPPPPLPPKLHGTNFNAENRFPLESYPHPPSSTFLPLAPQSYTGADFSISCKQPVVKNPVSLRQPIVRNPVSCRPPVVQNPVLFRQPINPVSFRQPVAHNPVSCRPPNIQNPDYTKSPPVRPPFSYPPPTQNLLISLPSSEVMKEHEGPITSSINKTRDINLERSPVESDKEDISYIQNWTSNVQKRLKTEESVRKTKEVKINDIQKKLLRYAILIKDLKELLKHVSDLSPASNFVKQEERESLLKRARKLKVDIEELRRYFSEEESLKTIKEILNKRREKRLKRRKTKGERNEKWKKKKEEWKKMEEQMDEKLRRENEEEKQKLEQEKLKREADMVLREVRSKQEDVVRMQKLLQALTSLRDIRKNKGEMHGYVENQNATTFFNKMKNEFETILSDQQKVYETEEQTLKIMIEESQCSMFSSRKRQPLFAPDLKEVKNNIYQIYFGRERPRVKAEKEYERSFLAAEESVEILVQRRKDWDQFLVGDNSGTSVPIGWVLPNLNPSSDWKTYQES